MMAHGPLHILIPATSAFRARRGFTDIEDPEMGQSWIFLDYPEGSLQEGGRHREGRWSEDLGWGRQYDAQNWGQSPKPGKVEVDPPRASRRSGWADSLMLDRGDRFWTSVFQNCKIVCLCCFKPLNLTITCHNTSRKRIQWSGGRIAFLFHSLVMISENSQPVRGLHPGLSTSKRSVPHRPCYKRPVQKSRYHQSRWVSQMKPTKHVLFSHLLENHSLKPFIPLAAYRVCALGPLEN